MNQRKLLNSIFRRARSFQCGSIGQLSVLPAPLRDYVMAPRGNSGARGAANGGSCAFVDDAAVCAFPQGRPGGCGAEDCGEGAGGDACARVADFSVGFLSTMPAAISGRGWDDHGPLPPAKPMSDL